MEKFFHKRDMQKILYRFSLFCPMVSIHCLSHEKNEKIKCQCLMLGNTLKARPSQNMCPLGSTLGCCLREGGHAPQVLSSTKYL